MHTTCVPTPCSGSQMAAAAAAAAACGVRHRNRPWRAWRATFLCASLSLATQMYPCRPPRQPDGSSMQGASPKMPISLALLTC
eukprot:1126118-Pelagomonas_calceolata.AAC.1